MRADQQSSGRSFAVVQRSLPEADRGNIALGALVAHVFVHEFAHHVGWSDADIAAIDRWWE